VYFQLKNVLEEIEEQEESRDSLSLAVGALCGLAGSRVYPPHVAPMGSAVPSEPFPFALSPTKTPSSALLRTNY